MGVTSRVPAICRERWPAPITVHRPRPRTRPAPAQMPAERGQHTVTARHGTRSQHGHSTRARKHGYIGAVTANRHIDTVTAQSQHGHSTVTAPTCAKASSTWVGGVYRNCPLAELSATAWSCRSSESDGDRPCMCHSMGAGGGGGGGIGHIIGLQEPFSIHQPSRCTWGGGPLGTSVG